MIARSFLQFGCLNAIFILIACASLDNIPITESSDTQIAGATIFEAFVDDLGFGNFLNIRLIDNDELENQGVTKSEIDKVFIPRLTLEILSPRQGDDFTFIESLTFKVSGRGLDTLDIARGTNFVHLLETILLKYLPL